MLENNSKYDLILSNNASREFFLFSGLLDSSENHLYHRFTDLELDIPEGEYTYFLLRNDRDDVEYEFKTPLGDTIIHTGDGDVVLKYLQAPTGLLRVGDVKDVNSYDNNDKQTIFYYDN